MNILFFATVCITCSLSLGIVEAQHTPPGHRPPSLHKKTKFRDPLEVKKIILECDTDKSGELSTEEFAKCVRMTIFWLNNLFCTFCTFLKKWEENYKGREFLKLHSYRQTLPDLTLEVSHTYLKHLINLQIKVSQKVEINE